MNSRVHEWIDSVTGRRIRQLTTVPDGAMLGYFRFPRNLPDGSILSFGKTAVGDLLALHPDSGDVQALPLRMARSLRLREKDGILWYLPTTEREIWAVQLPGGTPHLVVRIPEDVPGQITDISCDGKIVILSEIRQDLQATPVPTTMDLDAFWRYVERPRSVRLRAFEIDTSVLTLLGSSDTLVFDHIDASPTDSRLIKYCQDMYDGLGQRIWCVRLDGTDRRPIRPQETGELVTHEFWAGDDLIGYTYQDRRQDTTLRQLPWSEYAPTPTQLGFADLRGREVFISDPLNSYHTHLYISPDRQWVCGEGTDGNSLVYVAPLSLTDSRIRFVALASIHTPYIPFRGQMVNCGFTSDSRWLLYNDIVDGVYQVCAVQVDTS